VIREPENDVVRAYESELPDWKPIGNNITGGDTVLAFPCPCSMSVKGTTGAAGETLNDDNGYNVGHPIVFQITKTKYGTRGNGDLSACAAGDYPNGASHRTCWQRTTTPITVSLPPRL
jgi:hypothetical protein